MRRRKFIVALGGAAVWPLVAWAQKAMPVIGYLDTFARSTEELPEGFRQGLGKAGYVVGRNVAIEYRAAEGHYERLEALADDLVRSRVSVIAASGHPAARAAKASTSTIPIVFWTAGDPVADGIVAGLSRPDGNLTGVAMFNNVLGAKRLELLRQLVPKAAAFAMLVNPTNPNSEPQVKDAQEAARVLGVQIRILNARTDSEIEAAFATFNEPAAGLLVASDAYLFARAARLIALAAQYAVPVIYTVENYVVGGGLISYASNERLQLEFGSYIGRILNGAKPADLPVQRSTKFQLAINLKTAKSLGLTVPPSLLAQADRVIE